MTAHPEERSVQLGEIRLRALVWHGPNGRSVPLVIVHGLWDRADVFASVARRLAEKRTVYGVDLRGHGGSDRPRSGYTLDDYARDIAEVLEQLPEPQIDLLGHSLGGLVSMLVAAGRPASLRRLVLEDPPLLPAAVQEDVLRPFAAQFLELKQRPLEEVVSVLRGLEPSDEHAMQSARSLIDTSDGPFEAIARWELTPVDWRATLAEIDVPALAMAADPEKGGWLAGEGRRILEKSLPGVRIEDFVGCGHHIQAWDEDRFVSSLERFLDE